MRFYLVLDTEFILPVAVQEGAGPITGVMGPAPYGGNVDNRVRKLVVVDNLVHKNDEIFSSVHHGGHPSSHHGPPVGEGHGGVSPKIQGVTWFFL